MKTQTTSLLVVTFFSFAPWLKAQPAPQSHSTTSISSLAAQATRIQSTLATNERAFNRFGPELVIIIEKINELAFNPSSHHTIEEALDRYEAVARAIQSESNAQKKLDTLITLFDQRAKIINKIEATVRPSVYANLIIHDLPRCLNRAPTGEETAELVRQRNALSAASAAQLERLNTDLFAVEQEILAGHRSVFQKYIPALQTLGLLIIGTVVTGLIINGAHAIASSGHNEE